MRTNKFLLLFIVVLLTADIINGGAEPDAGNGKQKKKRKRKDVEIIVLSKPDDCGQVSKNGDLLSVDYVGQLEDGTIFDSSRAEDREPISFKLGAHKVIPGWEKGVESMCIGETRRLIIPPHLAYGEKGVPPHIPESATLIFEVELKGISSPSALTSIISFLKFISLPVALGVAIYFAYTKYKSNLPPTPSKKQLREEKRKKKR